MSFSDPLGFSTYSAFPIASTVSTFPGVEQQFYGQPPSFAGYPSPFPSMDSFSSFGMPSPSVLPFHQQQPGGDPMAGMMGMIGHLLTMVMGSFLGGGSDPLEDHDFVGPGGTDPRFDDDLDEPEVDSREQEIEGLDPNTNADLLQILDIYSDELGARNGKIDEKTLRKFAHTDADVPETVKKAAKNLLDNEELYNLLCLKSRNTPRDGFKLSALDEDDWDEEMLNELDSFANIKDAAQEIKRNYAKIDALSASAGISKDDLRKIALGESPQLSADPELQAAALAILSHRSAFKELDTINATTGAYDGTPNDTFEEASLTKWLS